MRIPYGYRCFGNLFPKLFLTLFKGFGNKVPKHHSHYVRDSQGVRKTPVEKWDAYDNFRVDGINENVGFYINSSLAHVLPGVLTPV
jgi:hypothetical protein